MKLFLKKYRIVFVLLLYFIIITGVFFFAIKPIIGEINSKTNKIQEILVNRENKEKRSKERPKLEEQYEMVLTEESKLTSLLEEDKAVDLIEKIEKLAQESGNEIIIEVKDGEKDILSNSSKKSGEEERSLRTDLPSSDYIEMNIKLEGNYNNLVRFVEKIETMEFYADIISFDISVKKDTSPGQPKTSSSPFSSSDTTGEEDKPEVNLINSVIGIVFYFKKQ